VETNDAFYVGQQIRAWRLRRGLTQEVLADLVGVSRALVGHYESGERELDSRDRLYRFATALQVSVSDLTHHTEDRLNPAVVNFHAAVPRIEAALMCVGNMDLPDALRPAADLARDADEILVIRAATDYQRLGGMLPDLITGLYQHTQSGDERDRRLAWGGLAKVAFSTALATKGLGHTSLAWTAANTACHAAQQNGVVADLAAGAYVRAQVMLATPGAVGASLKYTEDKVNQLSSLAATAADRQLLGMLHLHAGLTTAALGNDPIDHLRAVDGLVAQTGEGTAYEMSFGPANIAVWRMSMALEQHQGDKAIREAERVVPAIIDSPDRQSRYFIELGRGQFMEGDTAAALTSFRRAETIAPQQVRTRSTVREVTGQMVRTARRNLANSELGQFAARVGAVAA
jgi:transcriptional regulator with XRE-family HTH domain